MFIYNFNFFAKLPKFEGDLDPIEDESELSDSSIPPE